MLIELKFSARNLRTIVKVIVAVNLFLLAGSYFFNHLQAKLPHYLFVILRETDLASENVFAAWYSSMLLFLSAIMSFISFLFDEQRNQHGTKRILNYGWLLYAMAFTFLSFDELGSIHEYIGNFIAFKQAGKMVTAANDSGWILFYVVVAIVSLFMFVFSIVRLKQVRWALPLMVTALLLYLSNPFQEYLEIASMRGAGDETWKRPVYLLLLEEGTELFGSLFFVSAISFYAKWNGEGVVSGDNDVVFRKEMAKGKLMRLTGYFILCMCLCFLMIKFIFGDVIGDLQKGVPENWITAIIAFVISITFLFFFSRKKTCSYLLFSVFTLCISVYYGSNRFAYHFNSDYSPGRVLLRSVICAFALISFFVLKKDITSKTAKMGSMASLAIIAIGIFARRPYSAEITFTGLCLLVLIFIWDQLQPKDFNRLQIS